MNFHKMNQKEIIAQFKHLRTIMADVVKQPTTPDNLTKLTQLVTGDWEELSQFTLDEKFEIYYMLGIHVAPLIFPAMKIFYERNLLTPALLKKMLLFDTSLIDYVRFWSFSNSPMYQYLATIEDEVVWDLAQDLSKPKNCALLFRNSHHFLGSRYIVLALKHILKHNITHLNPVDVDNVYYVDPASYAPQNIISLMAGATADDITIPQGRANLILELRDVVESHPIADKTPIFKLLLPVATHFRDVLCQLIGWDVAIPLINLIHTDITTESDESDDLSPYFISVGDIKPMIETIAAPIRQELFTLLNVPDIAGYDKIYLMSALMGMNRDDIEAKLSERDKLAIVAYGLLPLSEGETVLDRYLVLNALSHDVPKNRRASQRATYQRVIRLALDYLAQQTGYVDASQLEWAMQAEWTENIKREWIVDIFTIQLKQDGAEIGLDIFKAGKLMKSVPKAARGAIYDEAMTTVKQLRSQYSRLRSDLLEGLIASGEFLPIAQIKILLRLPIARTLFPKLIWRNQNGDMGLLDVDAMMLVDLHGLVYPVGDELGLAHPYHLFGANILSEWQKYIIHNRIVQPIKQAFRELYILTPAEIQTSRFSNRFANHAINGAIATQLFVARGWSLNPQKGDAPISKRFGNIRAIFSIATTALRDSDKKPTRTGEIYFIPHPLGYFPIWDRRSLIKETDKIALDNIPPLIFSEVMRDADLIVSVAQWGDEPYMSKESYLSRAQLVTTLLDDLGLPHVRVEGHFAYVTGKLANYRVHLASAVIHIDPGNYLCIVPARWGMSHEKLFLPFSDDGDGKISEVISKILLLLADDKITDESILWQIRRK